MGTACHRVEERVAASIGQLAEAHLFFEFSLDVRFGGVLLALPALLQNGLHLSLKAYFSLTKGFYGVACLFLLLAYMALVRLKSIEQLRHCPPGEWGQLLGLDRAPEVRTLREKLDQLSEQGDVKEWCAELARTWMDGDPELAGHLYIDGHVRVYNGHQTKLPKRYVARQRLCLRGTTDYWVNDALGRPFFFTQCPIDPGLLKVLRENIVPRLLEDVPNQPSEEDLENHPYRSRFGLVFDREGYSPAFFKEMWEQRIACYTYRKYRQELWPDDQFERCEVTFPDGQVVTMDLAERGVFLGEKIWLREIRKRGTGDHQTSLVTTDYESDMARIAATMFSRWSQENFFKYMMQHFGINGLVDYGTSSIDETTPVVNPTYRDLSWHIRSNAAKLARRRAKFGAIILEEPVEAKVMQKFEREKAGLQEEIESFELTLVGLKAERKEVPKHIPFGKLPADQQFKALAPRKKQLVDTIKMVAYRAETALAQLLKPFLSKQDEARALLRQVFTSEADMIPNEAEKTLTVRLHGLTNPVSNMALQGLCDELNLTETYYPGTNLRMIYDLVSNQNP